MKELKGIRQRRQLGGGLFESMDAGLLVAVLTTVVGVTQARVLMSPAQSVADAPVEASDGEYPSPRQGTYRLPAVPVYGVPLFGKAESQEEVGESEPESSAPPIIVYRVRMAEESGDTGRED